ncbi:hypothetical protein AB0903_33620 [Streptomyces sp. NPDC048389]|uniref:hypothetical protein n=1 Tax=Streptomyces sp. NPDC048389 TaxID=3154622 RepID=UPI0034532BE1
MTPLEIAQRRCAHLPSEDRLLFMRLFEQGRKDAEAGADTEMTAWTLRTARLDAALAGYLEGLASTRAPALRVTSSFRERTCGRDSYAGYLAHLRAGQLACLGCLAANARRSAKARKLRKRRVMAR